MIKLKCYKVLLLCSHATKAYGGQPPQPQSRLAIPHKNLSFGIAIYAPFNRFPEGYFRVDASQTLDSRKGCW